jgi:glycosyltransferase involved in cell wall biosynthesis
MSVHKKNSLVVFVYDHFYPDFSAGGPITSFYNLSKLLKEHQHIRILTSAFEYQTRNEIAGVNKNCWTDWKGLSVWYATDRLSIKKAIDDLPNSQPVTFYLNGMFSVYYFLYPLWLAKKRGFRVIISPRGMLQQGAMNRGKLKKQIYILALKLSGLLRNVSWHATDKQEREDIGLRIGNNLSIMDIPNVPVVAQEIHYPLVKASGELRLVYFSLIAEKKNLGFVLELLENPQLSAIQLDIYGPIKDQAYWELCLLKINDLSSPNRVTYHGRVNPEKSISEITKSHALILATHGENFGHAIVEMLSASRPVIISDKTPWIDLEKYGAGYSLPLKREIWIEKLSGMLAWNEADFSMACSSALLYYQTKFNFDELKMRYLELFSLRL